MHSGAQSCRSDPGSAGRSARARSRVQELLRWWEAGATVGVGTVIGTFRSAPRPPGAAMLVGPGRHAPSARSPVAAWRARSTNWRPRLPARARRPPRPAAVRRHRRRRVHRRPDLRRHHRRVRRGDRRGRRFPEFGALAASIAAGEPVALATVTAGPTRPARPAPGGLDRRLAPATLGSARLDDAVRDDARGLLATGRTATADLRPGRPAPRRGPVGLRLLLRARRRGCWSSGRSTSPPRSPGSALPRLPGDGLRRPAGVRHRASGSRRPTRWSSTGRTGTCRPQVDAGALDGRTVICVLTHDPKFDVPVLADALRLPVAYVGAMGSRRHPPRPPRAGCREAGLTDAELRRLSSPIGLDLGARTPEETAISIAAEIIARRWDGGGRPLSRTGRGDPPAPGGAPSRPRTITRAGSSRGPATVMTRPRGSERSDPFPGDDPPSSAACRSAGWSRSFSPVYSHGVVGDRLVEQRRPAEIGGDGDAIPGSGVRPGQRLAAEPRRRTPSPRRVRVLDHDGALAVPELPDIEVPVLPSMPLTRCQPRKMSLVIWVSR